jgi:hypothetical protein
MPPSGWSHNAQRLWQAMSDGEVLDLTPDGRPGNAAADCSVSAEVLAHLMVLPPETSSGLVPRLRLRGAHIAGKLVLRYGKIEIPVELIDCRFDEPVDLANATVRAADFTSCHMPLLHADGLKVDADLTLTGLIASSISLFRAEIGGNIWLNTARLDSEGGDWAINGAQLRVEGGLYADSLEARGGVNLWGARAFSLEITHSHLTGEDTRPALRADGLTLTQDLRASGLNVSSGGIKLFGASVGGQFWLAEANISSTTGWAVNAPQLNIAGGIYGRGLTVRGGINLFRVTVGASIELPATTLIRQHSNALRAPAIHVGGDVILDRTARIDGDIDLSAAQIKGILTLSTAEVAHDATIDLRRATADKLDVTALNASTATLDLRGARIATIDDDADTWPQQIALDTLNYQALNPILPAHRRLAWLNRGSHYHPQPYEHLAAHYRQLGQDDDARTVLLAKHRRRRRTLRLPARYWSYLEDVTIGYGYRPGRALAWLLLLTATVATVFAAASPRPVQSAHPTFQPVVYALDLILPILDLGQERAFVPTGPTQWIAWASTIAGWLLATTAIAGITRRLARP